MLAPVGLEICEVYWLNVPVPSPHEGCLTLRNKNIQVQGPSLPPQKGAIWTKL